MLKGIDVCGRDARARGRIYTYSTAVVVRHGVFPPSVVYLPTSIRGMEERGGGVGGVLSGLVTQVVRGACGLRRTANVC